MNDDIDRHLQQQKRILWKKVARLVRVAQKFESRNQDKKAEEYYQQAKDACVEFRAISKSLHRKADYSV